MKTNIKLSLTSFTTAIITFIIIYTNTIQEPYNTILAIISLSQAIFIALYTLFHEENKK